MRQAKTNIKIIDKLIAENRKDWLKKKVTVLPRLQAISEGPACRLYE